MFHKIGAALEKHRSPYVTVRPLGTTSRVVLCDLSDRPGWYMVSISARYCGALPCRARCAIGNTLYFSLDSIGSQWSSCNTGVMWACLDVRDTILAAVFWTFCDLASSLPGIPYSRELQ